MNNNDTDTLSEDKIVLHRVKFFLLVVLQIPSIFICLSLFFFFITHRILLQNRCNQALQILLMVNFIQVTCDLPMVVHFYRLGRISPATAGYCTWWTFLEYTLNGANEFLMATISVQRHVLIFRSQLLNDRLKRWLIHHLPLCVCLVYPVILYLILVVFYPCDGTQWNFSANVCGLANCYLINSKILGTFDWMCNNGLPIVVIVLANVVLVIRVVRQKHRHHQLASWRKQRRMTLQLLSISCLYFFTWFPNLCLGFVQQLFIPTFLLDVQLDYIFDLTYLIGLLLPWIYLGVFPQFTQWMIKNLLGRKTPDNVVRPTNVGTTQL